MDKYKLRDRWFSLFASSDSDLLALAFKDLIRNYGESHRHYHTLTHVVACLELLDSVRDKLVGPIAVELALWFHDVIYDPTRSDNEDRSAWYAEDVLSRLGVSPEVIKNVSELIAITRHPSVPKSDDEKYMVDIDLAILGSPDDAYRQYAAQIRGEYSHIPEEQYRKGRAQVLDAFLRQDAIFHTIVFRERYEKAARENIAKELRRLTGDE